MEQISETFITQAIAYLTAANNIVILSHKNPDGDALGSGLALYQYFTEQQKGVDLVLPNQVPAYLNWMPNVNHVVAWTEHKAKAEAIVQNADLIIMVDFNHSSRIDQLASFVLASKAPKILIDHHPYPEDIADIVYSRVSSSSTAEMIFEFISELNQSPNLSKDVSECLYLGIMTDTGSFSYNSSGHFTFKVVSHLLNNGINKDAITDKVYDNYSQYRLQLLGHALNKKMKVIPEFGAAYIYLSKKELDEYHFEQGDTEGFVNYPLSIKGVVFSAIFIEKDGFTKCSFRSKGDFPANKVSGDYFNGGGHLNAAGGESKASLEKTIELFESILPSYKSYLK